jgi:hypothetical protein
VTSESALNKSPRAVLLAHVSGRLTSSRRSVHFAGAHSSRAACSTRWTAAPTGALVDGYVRGAARRGRAVAECVLAGRTGGHRTPHDRRADLAGPPFPERVDLTDVRASDARNATVTTANSRRFATSDGGATWSPLQEN